MADKAKRGCPPAPVGARVCGQCSRILADFESGRRVALPCPSSPNSFESAQLHQSAHVQAIRDRSELDLLPCTLVALGFGVKLGLQVIATLQACNSRAGIRPRELEQLAAGHWLTTVSVSARIARCIEVSALRYADLPVSPLPLDMIAVAAWQVEAIDYGVSGLLAPKGVEFPEDWGLVEVIR